ncbi:MAG: hypothetical protein ACYC8T_33470 [Myxococcaceae bacterium]
MRLGCSLGWALCSVSIAGSAWAAKPAKPAAKPAPKAVKAPVSDDWNTRPALPVLKVPRTPDPDVLYRAPQTPPPGDSFANDAEAEKAAREFLGKHFGKPTGTLELDKAVKTPGGYLVRFRSLFHGVPLRGAGAEVAFVGKTPSGAFQLITGFTVLPKSEKKIVTKEVAVASLEKLATAKTGQALTADQQAAISSVRLYFAFSPENMKAAGDRKEDLWGPVWAAERGPMVIDAYTGQPPGKD